MRARFAVLALRHSALTFGPAPAAKHTIGIDDLRATVKDYPLERVSEITGVDAELIKRAAEVIGRSKRHVSTCLQGV